MKSFMAKDGSDDPPGSGRNGERDFHGEKRSNATHASTTDDPDVQLYRKQPKHERQPHIGNSRNPSITFN